jgi:hypothetical protein
MSILTDFINNAKLKQSYFDNKDANYYFFCQPIVNHTLY